MHVSHVHSELQWDLDSEWLNLLLLVADLVMIIDADADTGVMTLAVSFDFFGWIFFYRFSQEFWLFGSSSP